MTRSYLQTMMLKTQMSPHPREGRAEGGIVGVMGAAMAGVRRGRSVKVGSFR